MALKKPSEFFNENDSDSALTNNAGIIFNENSPKVETVSEAFNSFKNNLEKIDALSDFTETFDKFKDNVEKVSILSEEVNNIHAHIKTLLKKEDLENAMMSHLVVVEQNIQDLQKNVKSLNSKTLIKIKSDFSDLSEKIEDFIDVEVPKYKKLLKESEIRVENKINDIDSDLEKRVDNLDEYIQQRINSIEESVESINEESLLKFEGKINSLSSELQSLVEVEIPKYKKIVAESRIKNEEGIDLLSKKVDDGLKNQSELVEDKILKINEAVNSFIEQEIPKYGNLLVETKINFENDLNKYKESISSEVFSSLEKIKNIKEELDENNFQANKSFEEKIKSLESEVSISLKNIDSIGEKYKRLYEDFKHREISNDRKLQLYSESLELLDERLKNNNTKINQDLKNLGLEVVESTTNLNQNIDFINQDLSKKIKSLEADVYINESHLKEQTKGYEEIKEEIYSTIKKLKIDFIEEQNKTLTDKIKYLEEIFNKFNEKTVLKEDGSLLTGTENEKTKDPLTPLDKNFVTFNDLSSHYRQFINRIQIQLASIGGGGAGFIKDLDDVDFDQTTGDGKILIYDQANSKWVGIASTAISGSQTLDGVLGSGNTSSLGMSVGVVTATQLRVGSATTFSETLVVNGDARITGILTIGTSTITLDPSTNVIRVGSGITLDATNNIISVGGNQIADSSGNANYSGIVTAGSIVAESAIFSGNITVGGTITYDDVTNVDSIGVVTARSGIEIGSGTPISIVSVQSATSTLATDSQTTIDTFSASTYRSAQYQIQITKGSSYHVTSLNILHDDTSVYLSEFGTIKTGLPLATFDSDISSGNVRILATPFDSSSTTFKIYKVLTKV